MVVESPTAPLSAPAEGILCQTPSTKLFIDDQEVGTATLYITEQNVLWSGGVRPQGGPAPTISLLYPTISLHAVQRDPSASLYLMLSYELRLPELATPQGSGDADDDDDFDPDNQVTTQLRFVPPNEECLQAMYAAMTQGQSLHPDPADVEDIEEEEDDDEYMDGEEFEDAEEFEAAEDATAGMRTLHLENANGNHCQQDGDDETADE